MKKSVIELYVKAVKASKRGEGGFKPKVHPHVASELLKEFRGNLFDSTKVKSKYTQGFKKTYNAFVACKGASGFSWNKANCMVVAPDNVWDEFLLHPCARQFRNTPFPEYNEYQIIFEGHTAKGDIQSPDKPPLNDLESGHLDNTMSHLAIALRTWSINLLMHLWPLRRPKLHQSI
ncbi:hypothetical protein KEM48_009255 [Puccinia striiformis f. sp. tritici PST-130]|nr:hypothetical protein KEM48_009255 [Puccinia striiformis f. sp. tritici PST-130]